MQRPAARAAVDLVGGGRKAEPLPRGPLLVEGRGLAGSAGDRLAGAWTGGRSPSACRASAGHRARGAESRPLGSVVVVSRSRGSSAGRAWEWWKAEPRPLGSVFVVGRSVGLSPPLRRQEVRAPPPRPGALGSRGEATPRKVLDDGPRKPAPHAMSPDLGARPGPQPVAQTWRHVPGSATGLRGEGWGPAQSTQDAGVKGRPSPGPGDRQWQEGPAPPPQRDYGCGAGERPTSPFFLPRPRPGSSLGRHRPQSKAISLGLGGGRREEPVCLSSSLGGRPCRVPSDRPRPEPLPGDDAGRKAGPASFNSLLAGRPSTAPLGRPSGPWLSRAQSPGPGRMRGAEPPSLTFSFGCSRRTPSTHPRWESGGHRSAPPSSPPFSGSFSPGPPASHWWKDEAPPLIWKARPPSPRISWARSPKSSPAWPRSEGNFPRLTSPPGLRTGGWEEPRPNFRSEVAWGCGPGRLSAQQCWLSGGRGAPSPPQPRRTTQVVPQPTRFRHQESQRTEARSSASFDPYWRDSPARAPPPVAGWKAEPRSLESLLMRKRNTVPFPPCWLEEGASDTYRGDSWKSKPRSPDPWLFGKRGSAPSPPYWAEGAATGPQLGDPWKPSDRSVDSVFGNRGYAPSAPYWLRGGTSVTPLGDSWRAQPRPLDFEFLGERSPAPSGPYWLEGGATSSPLRNGWKVEPRPLDFVRFSKQGRGSNSTYWLEGGATAPPLRDGWRAEPCPLDSDPLARYWSEGGVPPGQGRGIGRKEEPRPLNSSRLGWRSAAPLARSFSDSTAPDPGLGIFWEAEPRTVRSSALGAQRPVPQEAWPLSGRPVALGFGSTAETRPYAPPQLQSATSPITESGGRGKMKPHPQAQ